MRDLSLKSLIFLNKYNMRMGSNRYWTEDRIKELLEQNPEIKTRFEFKKLNASAYRAARKQKLLDSLFGELEYEKVKWTPNTIRQFIKEHPEINSRKKLKEYNSYLCHIAGKFGLLKELFGEKIKTVKYTEEVIREIVKQNPSIKSRYDLQKYSRGAWKAAKQLNILQDLFGDPLCINWTPDMIREYIKEHPEITTRRQLQEYNSGAYAKAKEFDMLYELFGEPTCVRCWTEEMIRQYVAERPEIKTRRDLEKSNISVYDKARKLKLLDELFGEPMRVRHWTEELIRKTVAEHPEITSRKQLEDFNGRAYANAKKLGILDELFGDCLHPEPWTEESIRQYVIDNNITSRGELEKVSPKGYKKAREIGILDELFGEPLHKYWSKEECAQLAQLCFNKRQFQQLYKNAYGYAVKKGWIDEICQHMNELIDFARPGKYLIYVYEDTQNHYAYVGLTNNAKRRDREHLMSNKDSLYKHCKKFDIAVPEMKIIKTDLSASQASDAEKRIYEDYYNSGWHMINTKKNLGLLGGNQRFRKDATKEINKILEEHPEITSSEELKMISQEAYSAAWLLNILDDIFPV